MSSEKPEESLKRHSIGRVHVPLLQPTDIKPHLGAPHHWQEGRSAKCLIDQWWIANDIPVSIRALLNQAVEWRGAELIDAFAERKTSLNDGRPSHPQSDLLAIVGLGSGLGVIAIEAKVDEGFDKAVEEWRRLDSVGKARRIEGLCDRLGIDPGLVGPVRYQLFHRVASALIEAKRYRANHAAMIVQSWCPRKSSFDDYVDFARLLEMGNVSPDSLSAPKIFDGIGLRIGWSAEA